MSLKINKDSKTPIYEQIINSVVEDIENKELIEGHMLPSINQLSKDHNLAKETVVKAFRALQQKGIVNPVHGKGFFITSTDTKKVHRVFILFDTLSSYKEVLYGSIQKNFGKDAYLDIFFHHFNFNVFKKLLEEAVGNYTSYIVLPFDEPRIKYLLESIPSDKLYLLDRHPAMLQMQLPGVYQDFFNDVRSSLLFIKDKCLKYRSFTLVFRNTITEVPGELRDGFQTFANDTGVKYSVVNSLKGVRLKKGNSFLVIDDEDLVWLVEEATRKKLIIGKDIGIISYNDTSLKKVVAGGISVISTDFRAMGSRIASMVLNGERKQIKNKCRFIDRNSF